MSGIQQLIKDGRAASKAAVRMAILERTLGPTAEWAWTIVSRSPFVMQGTQTFFRWLLSSLVQVEPETVSWLYGKIDGLIEKGHKHSTREGSTEGSERHFKNALVAACPFFVTLSLLVAESRNDDLGWSDEYGPCRLSAANNVFKHFYSVLISEIKFAIHVKTAQNAIKNGGLDTQIERIQFIWPTVENNLEVDIAPLVRDPNAYRQIQSQILGSAILGESDPRHIRNRRQVLYSIMPAPFFEQMGHGNGRFEVTRLSSDLLRTLWVNITTSSPAIGKHMTELVHLYLTMKAPPAIWLDCFAPCPNLTSLSVILMTEPDPANEIGYLRQLMDRNRPMDLAAIHEDLNDLEILWEVLHHELVGFAKLMKYELPTVTPLFPVRGRQIAKLVEDTRQKHKSDFKNKPHLWLHM